MAFWKHFIYRIVYLVPILLVASFGVFVLLRLSGSDPITEYLLLSNFSHTPEMISRLEAEFGLDKPIITQYVLWLQKAVVLDFGTSFMSGESVSGEFFSLLPQTLKLVGLGVVMIVVFSVLFGVISAMYKDRFPDIVISVFCFMGVCVPNFWLSFMLVWVFAISLSWIPAVWDSSFSSYVLPAVSISLMSLCITTRLLRSSMIEASSARHIIYAKMRSIPQRTIALKHIFANALLPTLAMIGLHFGELLGGAMIVESIFAIPGIGLYCINAISHHDFPIIQCFILVLCAVFALSNMLVDMLCAYIDPRLQL